MKDIKNIIEKGGQVLNDYLFRNYAIYAVHKNKDFLYRSDYYLIHGDLYFIEKYNGNIIAYGIIDDHFAMLDWLETNNYIV